MVELKKKRGYAELKKILRQYATFNRRIKKHFKIRYRNQNKNLKYYTKKACHSEKILIIIKYNYQQPRISKI